jgi:predicted adenine nucleotide alpha hydrolase (AANH) superfamily ATPase
MGIKKWTSSLNNSPHKDMEKMFALWEKWDSRISDSSQDLTPTLSSQEREQAAEVLGISLKEYEEKIAASSLLAGENWERFLVENGLQEKLEFLKIAFRKNGGFQRSVDYTNKHNIFRQNYCGCVYSDTFPWSPRAKNSQSGFSG